MIDKLGEAIIALKHEENALDILKKIGVDKVSPEIYKYQLDKVEKAREMVEEIGDAQDDTNADFHPGMRLK